MVRQGEEEEEEKINNDHTSSLPKRRSLKQRKCRLLAAAAYVSAWRCRAQTAARFVAD